MSANENWVKPSTTSTVPVQQHPHPCPSCGHCPTCGRGGHTFKPWPNYGPYWVAPYQATWTVPQTTWTNAVGPRTSGNAL